MCVCAYFFKGLESFLGSRWLGIYYLLFFFEDGIEGIMRYEFGEKYSGFGNYGGCLYVKSDEFLLD